MREALLRGLGMKRVRAFEVGIMQVAGSALVLARASKARAVFYAASVARAK
jgi:hypothetical protein